MTTPMRPVPDSINRWIGRRRWLRWGDAFLAWVLLWIAGSVVLGSERLEAAAVVAAIASGSHKERRADTPSHSTASR